MKDKELQFHLPSWKAGNPITNKEDIRFILGVRTLNYYKNDFTSMGKVQQEIMRWKGKGGMNLDEIKIVLEDSLNRELEECVDDNERNDTRTAHASNIRRIEKILEQYDGKRTGIVLLGSKTQDGHDIKFWTGGSGGSLERGGCSSGAPWEPKEERNLASVELPAPQEMRHGNNSILQELFENEAICEMWNPDYRDCSEYNNLSDMNEKYDGDLKKKLGAERNLMCMGIFKPSHIIYGIHRQNHAKEIENSSWTTRMSFQHVWIAANAKLQLEYQLQKLQIIEKKKKIKIVDEKVPVQEAHTRDEVQKGKYDNNTQRLVARWMKRKIHLEEEEKQESNIDNNPAPDGEGAEDDDQESHARIPSVTPMELSTESITENSGGTEKEGDNEKETIDDREKLEKVEMEGGVKVEDVFQAMCNASVAQAGRFMGRHITNGEADVLLGGCFANLGWVVTNVPMMSFVRSYNATTMTYIKSFHDSAGRTSLRRIQYSPGNVRKALMQAVVNRSSGMPLVFQEFADHCCRLLDARQDVKGGLATTKMYIPGPVPGDIEQFETFLVGSGYTYRDIRSTQFSLEGFPPTLEMENVRHYTKFLLNFRDNYLEELVNLANSDNRSDANAAEKFGNRLRTSLISAATHTWTALGGWKTVNFLLSQIMCDVVEVLDDFYLPEHFIQFGTGAVAGHKMFKCSKKQLSDGSVEQRWINSKEHKIGRVFGNKMMEYLKSEDARERLPLVGLKLDDKRNVCVSFSERRFHGGDTGDHIPCEMSRTFQRTSRSRLHNKPAPYVNYEYPIHNLKRPKPDDMWGGEVVGIFKSILDFAECEEGKKMLKPAKNFMIPNEEDWKRYSLLYDDNQYYDGFASMGVVGVGGTAKGRDVLSTRRHRNNFKNLQRQFEGKKGRKDSRTKDQPLPKRNKPNERLPLEEEDNASDEDDFSVHSDK